MPRPERWSASTCSFLFTTSCHTLHVTTRQYRAVASAGTVQYLEHVLVALAAREALVVESDRQHFLPAALANRNRRLSRGAAWCGVARLKSVAPRNIGCTSMTSAKDQNAVSSSGMSARPETAGTLPCQAAQSQHSILWTYKSTLVSISSHTRPPARRASAVRHPVRVMHCRRPTTGQAL
jgi:hypothetical protein